MTDQPPPSRRDRAQASLLALVRAYVRLCARRGPALVVLVLALTGGMLYLSQGLTIDSRLEALLPDDARSVAALEEATKRVPVQSKLQLLVQSDDPALNRRLAEQLASAVREWPETRWAVTARDPEGLWERRLLFAPAERLDGWASAVEDRLRWERCERVPGCVNFDDAPELPTEAEVRAQLEEVPELASLSRFYGQSAEPGGGAVTASDAPEGSLCSEDGTLCAVDASLSVSARELGSAGEIYERTLTLFDALRPADAPSSLRMEISGPFRNGPLTKKVTQEDLARVSIVSTLLVVLILAGLFRGVRAQVVILAPMAMATSWVLGILGVLGLELNLISSFTFAILVGIGTDYGLHMAVFYAAKREEGMSEVEAMEQMLMSLGASIVTAAATTALAFASLTFASFQGFSQMGAVAALGIAACLVAYLFVVPLLILAWEKVRPARRSWNRGGQREGEAKPPRFVKARVIGGLVLALLLGLVGAGVGVETNFHNLRAEGVAHGLSTGDAVHGTNGVGAQVIGEDPEEVARATWEVYDAVREGLTGEGGALALTGATFVPADQGERLEAIGRLRAALDDARAHVSGADLERLEDLAPLVAVDSPIEPSDLPPWILDWLVDADGRYGHLGLIFMSVRGTDAVAMEKLARILDTVAEDHPDVVVASDAAILGEVLPSLFRDGPVMVLLALGGLGLAVWGIGRRLSRVLWVLLPLSLCVALSAGLMVLFDVKLNLYNLLILPVAFGIGVDGAVYTLYAAEQVASGAASDERLEENSRALFGATLTTVTGFTSLMLSHHLGIVSIGALGSIAIGTTMFANLVWFPALLQLVRERRGAAALLPTPARVSEPE